VILGDIMDKDKIAKDVLKHSDEGNLEKANELLDKYMTHNDTSKKEIDELVMKALIKAQKPEQIK